MTQIERRFEISSSVVGLIDGKVTQLGHRTGVSNTRPVMWSDLAMGPFLENVRGRPTLLRPGLPNAKRKHASSLGEWHQSGHAHPFDTPAIEDAPLLRGLFMSLLLIQETYW
ncbi:hypothetical protein L345_08137, partial [Ophiophagus hannah]